MTAEEAMIASEVRYRRLFETAQDGILILDAETGMVVDVNPFLIAMLGFSREAFLGKKVWELGFFKDIAANQDNFAELQRKEYVRYDDKPLETADGRRIEVEFVSNVYRVNHLKVIQCNIRDITQHKRSEAALEAANQELEAFSFSVSHDLRAPLRAIDGFANILVEDYTKHLDAEGQGVLHTIRSEAKRMGQLIDDLLAFSRMGRQAMRLEEVDMGALVQAAFDQCAARAPGRRLQFAPQALPPAQGDPALLRQVLVNLLANAIKFTRAQDVVVIEVGGRVEAQENLYYVKDNGTGFDMKYVHKLFGVFQRLHSETEFEGTGVGLAIVQRIIHRHGGRVWAEGKVNAGATFYFTLPVVEMKKAEE